MLKKSERLPRFFAALFLTTPALTWAAPVPAADDSPVHVEYLSEVEIPGGFEYEGTCVGGLSALAYDSVNERYFAVSDAAKDARYYTLRIDISAAPDSSPKIQGVEFESVVRLRTREGLPYPEGRVDPEGLALLDETSAFISSEGMARDDVPPFIDRIELATGEWLGQASIPLYFKPRHRQDLQTQGVRHNKAFESLTLTPNRRDLYVATESALAQDVRDLPSAAERYARLLHYRLETVPKLVGEMLYPLRLPEGNVVAHGLVELLALDDSGRLLAMERSWGPEIGMAVKLFEVRLAVTRSQVDRSRLSRTAVTLPVLDKRQILDFKDLPIVLDNFEGLTFGPLLPDGSESLLILGDNDNTECRAPQPPVPLRPTKFLLVRLRR